MEAERVMGLKLIRALGAADAMPLSSQEERLPWTSRAISIYQVNYSFVVHLYIPGNYYAHNSCRWQAASLAFKYYAFPSEFLQYENEIHVV